MPVEVEAKVVGVASNDGAAVEVDASADSEGNEVPLPSGHDGGARDRDSKSCNRMADQPQRGGVRRVINHKDMSVVKPVDAGSR